MRRHYGEKPFACNLCNYRSVSKQKCREHQERCKKIKKGQLKIIKDAEGGQKEGSDQQKLEYSVDVEARRKWLRENFPGQIDSNPLPFEELGDDHGENESSSVSQDNNLYSLMTSSVSVVENNSHICLLCKYKTQPKTVHGFKSLATQRALMERHMTKFHLGQDVSGYSERFKQYNQQQQPEPPQVYEKAAERIISSESLKSSVTTKFSHDDVTPILKDLHLTSVEIGDYLLVMSAREDAVINEEPYIAFQLWLNMQSGKVIQRLWGQTVACTRVTDRDELKDVCSKHFADPPCVGCPMQDNELPQKVKIDLRRSSTSKELLMKMQDFVISQTPVPRTISLKCMKVVRNYVKPKHQACIYCLQLMPREHLGEDPQDSEVEIKVEDKMEDSPHKTAYEQFTTESEGQFELNNDDELKGNPEVTIDTVNVQDIGKDDLKATHAPKPIIRSKCPKPSNVKDSSMLRERGFHTLIKGPFDIECDFCSAIVRSNSFKNHMKKAHGKTEFIKRNCFWCGQTVSVGNMIRHARVYHFWGKFNCQEPKCSFRGNFAKDLVQHINDSHPGDVDAKCPLCKKGCAVIDIESHYVECVKELKLKAKREEILKAASRCCDVCGKVLKRGDSYKSHKLQHLREQAAKGDTSIDIAALYFPCDKCDKKYVTRLGLKLHVQKVHDDSSKFPCPSCGLVFRVEQELTEHERMAHSTDEQFQCKDCGKRFGKLHILKKHQQTHGDAQFKCKYCPKVLKTAKILKYHERYHTGEKPFTCSICGNGYVSKGKLQQHVSGVHKIEGPGGRKPGWNRGKKKRPSQLRLDSHDLPSS